MGLSRRCRLLGLVGKHFPPCLRLPYFKAFGFSPSYLPWGLMGLSPSSRLLGLVGKNLSPLSLPALFQGFWILTLISSTLGSWGYPSVVDFWDLSAKMCVCFCFLSCQFYPNSSTLCRPLFWALIPGKPIASSDVTYQVFVILARFFTVCHGQPSFWDSQPYLHWA